MCRSFERSLKPEDHKYLTVETYTYTPSDESTLAGTVFIDIESREAGMRIALRLTPAEARTQAQHLLDAAAQGDADPSTHHWLGSSYRALAGEMAEVAYAPTVQAEGAA